MKYYKVSANRLNDDVLILVIGFGESATNDKIVVDAVQAVKSLELTGGKVVCLNGPASLPVAVALSHELSHRFGAVYCFDPKLASYVCAVSHDPAHPVGNLYRPE